MDPSPPLSVKLMCALTSAALGPVYVNTPVVFTYDKLPSPPVSTTLKCCVMFAGLSSTTLSMSALLVPVYWIIPFELAPLSYAKLPNPLRLLTKILVLTALLDTIAVWSTFIDSSVVVTATFATAVARLATITLLSVSVIVITETV